MSVAPATSRVPAGASAQSASASGKVAGISYRWNVSMSLAPPLAMDEAALPGAAPGPYSAATRLASEWRFLTTTLIASSTRSLA